MVKTLMHYKKVLIFFLNFNKLIFKNNYVFGISKMQIKNKKVKNW